MADKSAKTAITPTRLEDYPAWYQAVIKNADLAENSLVRGCMVIKPWGYAIWEQIQGYLDWQFKKIDPLINAYFPLLIPLSQLQNEAGHVAGFAKECAVVTHHRLAFDENGHLGPDASAVLEEPLVIRPTSETIIGASYAKWIKSYRDLPLRTNQWANVMRWEMRPRLFLRTAEFLWQEGHTAHATSSEATTEAADMIAIYADFAINMLAIPVFLGIKPVFERFPGAVVTHTIEAIMQDGKALQMGTSHFLGQNFSKAANIEYANKEMILDYVWTTSWGVSTRLIGALIMSHSDDNGLVLPPYIAPIDIVINPVFKRINSNSCEDNAEDNLSSINLKIEQYCKELKANFEIQQFNNNFTNRHLRVKIDERDIANGDKKWQWIKKGIPLYLEIGANEIINNKVAVINRLQIAESGGKLEQLSRTELLDKALDILEHLQQELLAAATARIHHKVKFIASKLEFEQFAHVPENSNDITAALAYASDDAIIIEHLTLHKITARCIVSLQSLTKYLDILNISIMPNQESITLYGTCIFTGAINAPLMLFAQAY